MTLSTIAIKHQYDECRYADSRYAECYHAECRYTECRGASNPVATGTK